MARWGRINVLVNNVGVNPHFGAILDIDRARWDKIFEIKCLGTAEVDPAGDRGGPRAHGGRRGRQRVIQPVADRRWPAGTYGASKATLNYLTRQLAVELAPSVRVDAVAPGVVDTDMAAMLSAQGERLADQWPLPRFGIPTTSQTSANFLPDHDPLGRQGRS
jgi:NAD(P)-dependent dehydrogenase (short-subunit alcohol dehydrogenase family)